MKKKLIPLIFVLVCTLICALAFAACDETTVPAESVTLSQTTFTLDVGGTSTLTATVKPENVTDKTVTWSSDKTDVATVDNAGNVTAVAAGTATITAKTSNGKSATCTVTVNDAPDDDVNYVAHVSKTSWKYLEDAATVTLKDENDNDVTDFTAKCITETDYDEIKDAADFNDQLASKSNTYTLFLEVGAYYLFAEVDTANNDPVYSSFVKVTVNKADLTINNPDKLSAVYNYDGKIGKVKLSEIFISNYYEGSSEDAAHAVDVNNESLNGDFVWANPDEEVDSTNNGQAKSVKFVTSDPNYAETTVDVTLTIHKGHVNANRPGDGTKKLEGEQYKTWDYYRPEGVPVTVATAYRYKELVNVTTNVGVDTTIEIADDAGHQYVIDTIVGTWTPTYTFSLKDKTNYYWVPIDEDGWWENDVTKHDTTNTDDILLTFRVYKVLQDNSWCGLSAESFGIDKDGKLKVWVGDPNYYEESVGLTYQKDVAAEIVDTDENGTNTTQAVATIEKVDYATDSAGHERAYILLNVTDLSQGSKLCIKITATGRIGYEDVNLTQCIDVHGYFDESDPIVCPITEGLPISQPAGTLVSVLYAKYAEAGTPLVTALGKWKLYIEQGENNWVECLDTDSLLEGTNSFKLEFDNSKKLVFSNPESVTFTITGTPTTEPTPAA